MSWSIVLGKRDAFRTAFRGFDVDKVAAMTERAVDTEAVRAVGVGVAEWAWASA